MRATATMSVSPAAAAYSCSSAPLTTAPPPSEGGGREDGRAAAVAATGGEGEGGQRAASGDEGDFGGECRDCCRRRSVNGEALPCTIADAMLLAEALQEAGAITCRACVFVHDSGDVGEVGEVPPPNNTRARVKSS